MQTPCWETACVGDTDAAVWGQTWRAAIRQYVHVRLFISFPHYDVQSEKNIYTVHRDGYNLRHALQKYTAAYALVDASQKP